MKRYDISKSYDVYDVFTPTKPARLTFIERENINLKLVDAIRTPGKQLVVYGHSGSGKTTLLVNKLHQLYSHHITTRCMIGITYDQIILDAFDQLSPFYASEIANTKNKVVSAQLSQAYFAIKSQLSVQTKEESVTKSVRALPPQLTPTTLARFLGEIDSCWVLEDFHKVEGAERNKLSQTMKVFMDMADEYKTVKVIAIGAVDTARQVVEYDKEMRNRVAEIHVPLMEETEIEQIIEKGAGLLNVSIGKELVTGISNYANGLASVCHNLCLNLCTANGIYETVDEIFVIEMSSLETAVQTYLDEASDTLKKTFDTALKQKKSKKYDNGRLILKALSQLPQEGAVRAEIYKAIKKVEPTYPQGNLTSFLKILSGEEDTSILRFESTSGRYSFRDPIYRAFALAFFSKEKAKVPSSKRDTKLLSISYDEYLEASIVKIVSDITTQIATEKKK